MCQIHERANYELTEDDYFHIIDGKTAELCALCCHLGAHFAGANSETIAALESYGRSLGKAFQIADDLLDILGHESSTGKSLGTDLEKQKLTLPFIRMIQTAADDERARLRELLAQPGPDARSELMKRLEQSDGIEYSHKRADEFAADALAKLSLLPESSARQVLEQLPVFASRRSF